jgi:aspartate dehydrogenase
MIVADPSLKHNVHELELTGEFGSYRMQIENLPSSNPKTSLMAALSAIALLKDLMGNIHIGT